MDGTSQNEYSNNKSGSDLNWNEKYTTLENNHRRLLGITTTLTEALENTIRGFEFDMEETLNQCMTIYPELFTLQIKKPSSGQNNFKKIYNTSEDFTDIGESESKINQNITLQCENETRVKPTKHNKSTQHIDRVYPDNVRIDNQILGNGSFLSAINMQPMRVACLPISHKVNHSSQMSPSVLDNPITFTNQSNITFQCRPDSSIRIINSVRTSEDPAHNLSDTSPYLIKTPELCIFSSNESNLDTPIIKSPSAAERNSFYPMNPGEYAPLVPTNDNSNASFISHEKENQQNRFINLSEYHLDSNLLLPSENINVHTINHTSSKSPNREYFSKKENSFETTSDIKAHYEINNTRPYEIIVQQSPSNNSETDLLIKIIPEEKMEKKHSLTDSKINSAHYDQKEKHNSISDTRTQKSVTRPSETLIIITNHVDDNTARSAQLHDEEPLPNNKFLENLASRNDIRTNKDITVLDDLEDNIRKDYYDNQPENRANKKITIEKLQQLSTGLKVQVDVMQPLPETVIDQRESKTILSEQLITPDALERPRSSNTAIILKEKHIFDNIKDKMLIGSVKQRASILQSLRMKLIHTLAKERSCILASYIENDILNIKSVPTLLEEIMPKEIVNGWDLILQEMIFKFLNTISSMWKGRDYLTTNTKTLETLQTYFNKKYSTKTSTDQISKDMLIAVLHKLSTRQNQQIILINSGVTEKINIDIVEKHDSMSSYRLRHCLGLLVNLTVTSHCRKLIEHVASVTLTVLAKLLSHKDKKIVTYVIRLIYILMANDKFHKTAKDMKLTQPIEEFLKKSNKRTKLQLEILKNVIQQPLSHQNLNDSEDIFLQNIEAEVEELEEEVELGEPFLLAAKEDISASENNWENNLIFGISRARNLDERKLPNNNTESRNMINQPSNIPTRKIVNKEINQKTKQNSLKTKRFVKMDYSNRKNIDNGNIKVVDKTDALPKTRKSDRSKIQRFKPKIQHEIDEDNEPNTSEVALKEVLGKIIQDQAHSSVYPNRHSIIIEHKNNVAKPNCDENDNLTHHKNIIINNPQNKTIEIDNTTSFIILNNKESKKSLNPSSIRYKESGATTTSSPVKDYHQWKETIQTPNSNHDYMPVVIKSSSLFSPDRDKSNNDYDYCEDTKQIQLPLHQDNIFKDNRQSPYRGLLAESKKTTITLGSVDRAKNLPIIESSVASTETP